jgi:hypothetical protein
VNHLVGVPHHGRYVGSGEVPAISHADDQRASSPGDNDLIRSLPVDHRNPEGPLDLGHGFSHCFAEVSIKAERDEMGQHLGVGLRPEPHAGLFQPFPDRVVVLDDSVMDDKDVFGLVPVRMRILLARLAVSGPAGVRNSAGPGKFHVLHLFFQFDDFAHRPVKLDPAAKLHGHAGRIVTAVLQPFEPFKQDRLNLVFAHIADDAAHLSSSGVKFFWFVWFFWFFWLTEKTLKPEVLLFDQGSCLILFKPNKP